MPKNQEKGARSRRRPSGRQIAFYVLSIVIVLSMTIGYVVTMFTE